MNNITFEKNVLDVYENIAPSFDKTRYDVWPEVQEFLNMLEPGTKVLDVGCGNGKNMLYRSDLQMEGCDTCNNFIDICKAKNLIVKYGNILNLPYDDNSFDIVICIAVIHHLLTNEDRQKAIKELQRVSIKLVFVEVWAEYDNKPHKFRSLGNHDYLVKWNNCDERYYHLFDENEVDILLADREDVIGKKKGKFNWCITLKK